MEFKGNLTKSSATIYKSPGEGNHIMGLVAIKDCVKKYQGLEKPGVQFVFKSVSDPAATVSYKVTSSLFSKSNLYKALRRMAPGRITENTTPQEALVVMNSLDNNWFEVSVIESHGDDGRTFANVDDNMIKPARPEVCPKKRPLEYFESVDSKQMAMPEPAPEEGGQDDIPF